MTRTRHDLFAKQHLEALLETIGTVTTSRKIISETREIDLLFVPHQQNQTPYSALGILGQMATHLCLMEPFRNAIQTQDVMTCIGKLIDLSEELRRKAKRETPTPSESALPHLWILSPTLSQNLIQQFAANPQQGWPTGFYSLPLPFRTTLVAVHQLPVNESTLWLRLMGRNGVQQRAITELLALPEEHPMKSRTIEHLAILQISLSVGQNLSAAERALAMNLTPVYEKWRRETLEEGLQEGLQQGLQEGLQQGLENGERALILRQLTRRLGTLPPDTEAQIRALSLPQLEALGEALLDFTHSSDLIQWLNLQSFVS